MKEDKGPSPRRAQDDPNDWKIRVTDTAKKSIPLRKCQKDGLIPKFPFSWVLCGRSGSGKTNLLMNILTRQNMLKHYFHYILVFSPTSASGVDDSYKGLGLPKENFVEKFGEEDLQNIIDAQKNLIKQKGISWVGKNSRVCIILDDVVANRQMLHSPSALKLFCLLRHYLVSVIIMIQSYTKLPRALRLNANATCLFPSSQSEIEITKEEIRSPGLTRNEWQNLVEYAISDDFSFLYINNHAKKGEQVRKNLDEIIDINAFKKNKVVKDKDKHVQITESSFEDEERNYETR